MSTGLGSKRWLGVMLLIALFSLFTVADLQAKDARPMDVAPIGTCDFGELDADPWMEGVEPVAPCPGYELSEVQSFYLLGDYGLMRIVVGDEVESHFYQRTDTGWEQIHVMSTDDGEWDHLIELENASTEGTQGVGFSIRPSGSPSADAFVRSRFSGVPSLTETDLLELELDRGFGSASSIGALLHSIYERSRSTRNWPVDLLELSEAEIGLGFSSPSANLTARSVPRGEWAVEYEMTGDELQLGSERRMNWESIQFAPVGDAYLEYLFELERNETDH